MPWEVLSGGGDLGNLSPPTITGGSREFAHPASRAIVPNAKKPTSVLFLMDDFPSFLLSGKNLDRPLIIAFLAFWRVQPEKLD